MKKVSLTNSSLLYEWYRIITPISVLITIFSIAITIPEMYKKHLFLTIIISFILLYFYLWNRANKLLEKKVIINKNLIKIKFGDIFEEEGLKVIAFNEYFDTKVDNVIISNNSLNGFYLNRYVSNVKKLDDSIKKDITLSNNIIESMDSDNNRNGNNIKFKLGTVYKNGEYLLLAFSKFDTENRAFISTSEYFNCLLSLWEKIDISFNGEKIVIPLLGSGITRFKETNTLSDQELLEFLILSLKLSKIKYLDTHEITIVIHQSKKNKVNLYSIN